MKLRYFQQRTVIENRTVNAKWLLGTKMRRGKDTIAPIEFEKLFTQGHLVAKEVIYALYQGMKRWLVSEMRTRKETN